MSQEGAKNEDKVSQGAAPNLTGLSGRPRRLAEVEMLAGLIGIGFEEELLLLLLAAIVPVTQEVDTGR